MNERLEEAIRTILDAKCRLAARVRSAVAEYEVEVRSAWTTLALYAMAKAEREVLKEGALPKDPYEQGRALDVEANLAVERWFEQAVRERPDAAAIILADRILALTACTDDAIGSREDKTR